MALVFCSLFEKFDTTKHIASVRTGGLLRISNARIAERHIFAGAAFISLFVILYGLATEGARASQSRIPSSQR